MQEQTANRDVVEAGTFPSRRPALLIAVVVFLVGAFLYVWLRVEPLLEYHTYGPYLFRQRAFMETFLRYPGGLVSYAGVALAQLNFSNALGALMFVVIEGMIFLAALFCLARI